MNTNVKDSEEIDNRYTFLVISHKFLRISQIKWNLVITVLILSLCSYFAHYKSNVKETEAAVKKEIEMQSFEFVNS